MSRKERNPWIWIGTIPVLGAIAWWVGGRIARRRKWNRELSEALPPDPYGLEPAPDFDFTSRLQERYEPAQVPVTARSNPAGKRRGVTSYNAPDQVRTVETGKMKTSAFPWLALLLPAVILVAATSISLLGRMPARAQVVTVPGGNVENGRQSMQAWGCGSCHTIPGVAGAYGKVGPRLDQMAEQSYIAGMLPNTPENMIKWIMDPQEIQPGNAMPDTEVSIETARDMAAYLYSIR